MKIVIPVNKNKEETDICVSFGRTPFFMVYDTETKEKSFIQNEAADSSGGAGIKAAQLIVDIQPDALLTPRCGEKALDVLGTTKIKLYKTTSDSVEGMIGAYMEDNLAPIEATR